MVAFLWTAPCWNVQGAATGPARPVNFVTDFADQAVTLPLAACVLFGLVGIGWRRGALAWGGCVAGVLSAMLLLKLVAMACGRTLAWTGVLSPSGHTATAAVVYGGLLALLAPRSVAGTLLAAATGGAMALLFGLTRLELHVHTLPDVLLGAAVGVSGAMLMRHLAGVRPPRLVSPWLLAPAVLVVLVFHGDKLQAEERIRWLAMDVWPLDRCD